MAIGDSGILRFKATNGAASVGTAVTATVSNSATLELAGSVSSLSAGANRVNIVSNSTAAAGILVSGTHQQVGNIDGSGTTQINAGSDLTADHIIQSALVIGGTTTSQGLLTIDASDALGNPLVQSSGFAWHFADARRPIRSGRQQFRQLEPRAAAVPIWQPFHPVIPRSAVVPSPVPEPSTLLLVSLRFWV